METTEIRVTYSSLDGYRKTRKFRTLAGASKFAKTWVGADADFGSTYAVSFDGIGKITVEGTTLAKLFGREEA